jgi:AraC family ethanolamine operon transcriptional activator
MSEAHFQDPDQAAAAIRSTHIEFALLAPSSSHWSVGNAPLADTSLWWGHLGATSCSRGTMPDDTSWLLMAGEGTRNWTLNRQALGEREICFVPNATEYAASYPQPGAWFALAFPRVWIEEQARILMPQDFQFGERIASFDLCGDAAKVRHAFALAASFAAEHPELIKGPETRAMLQNGLASALLGAIEPERGSAARRNERLLSRVLEYLDANPHRIIHQQDICGALGTNTRALRRLFPEAFGTSPGNYLRLRRLHLARRGLVSGQFASVTKAAVHFGFFDLGRFAASYRRLFGEMPSHTLARALR